MAIMKKKLTFMSIYVGVAFILLSAASAIYFSINMDSAESMVSSYAAGVEEMMTEEGTPSFFGVVFNNLFACAVTIGFGIVPFIFLPILSLISNATLIGALIGLGSATGTLSPLKMIFIGLLPHGLFELPAIFLSMAMGIYLCQTLTRKILRRSKEEKLMDVINGLAKTFVLVVIPLLIVASAVESTITPMLINQFGM